MKIKLRSLLLFLIIGNLCFGQKDFKSDIDSIISSKMKEYKIQGLSLGIVRDGEVLYSTGYGFTDTDNSNPVTSETRFGTGSITKLFTITAIMQLSEQGKLDINKKITDYIPDFRLKDNRYRDITILHLITHSSGLPWDNYLTKTTSDSAALQEFILSLKNSKLNFTPGEKFDGSTYSNTGYDILGYIVEKISGMPFQDYINRYILRETLMNNTTYFWKNIPVQSFAQPIKIQGNSKEIRRFNLYGEIKDKNPILKYPDLSVVTAPEYLKNNREHFPSGFLFSSSDDLCLWIMENLSIYNNQSDKILSNATLTNMWSLYRDIEGKKTSIGLGWWRYADQKQGEYVFHVGRVPGYSSVLRIYPKNNIGIVILCNAMYAEDLVWNKLPELILPLIPANN